MRSAGIFGGFVLLAAGAIAAPQMTSQSWPDNDASFAEVQKQIEAISPRNLLIGSNVQMFIDHRPATEFRLVDANAGERGNEGRVFLSGKPSTVTFYLGAARPIREVQAFSFNCDTRSNQRIEVRFADNSGKPGQMPAFPAQPTLTTGDKIVGADRGGFLTRFADSQAPLAKADWVEFRVWPTLGLKAGDPVSKESNGASVLVELAVLGEPNDVPTGNREALEYAKALREMPREPEFVKKSTWLETMIAGRESLMRWEARQDAVALMRGPVRAGAWHVLGPISTKSKDFGAIRSANKIDLAAKYQGLDGKEIGWQRRDDLVDGDAHQLAANAPADAAYLLYRTMSVVGDLKTHRGLGFSMVADRASGQWLPDRRGLHVFNSFPLFNGQANLEFPVGEYGAIFFLQPNKDGQCRFCFRLNSDTNRPGGGQPDHRIAMRRRLVSQVTAAFEDPTARAEIEAETAAGVWHAGKKRQLEDWVPGHADAFMKNRYRLAIDDELQDLQTQIAENDGITARAVAGVKEPIANWAETMKKSLTPELDAASLRGKFYAVVSLREAVAGTARTTSMRMAVEDQRQMFGSRYPKAGEYLQRIGALESQAKAAIGHVLGGDAKAWLALSAMKQTLETAQQEILLETPLLDFGKLLIVKGGPHFSSNWDGPNNLGNEIQILSPVRPNGTQTTIYKGTVSDMDLHWDAKRMLFSDRNAIFEMNVDGSGVRRVSAEQPPISHYDACYLPNGQIVCASNACYHTVPCTGGPNVGNLHIMDADGKNERRVTFDQDHNWNPVVMHDGRVLYTRWEYTDTPHYFTRMLFRMNPDGAGQMEYYGSGSYWPNSMYWPRPIPGHTTAVSCVVSGHHGVSRSGELLLLDPARGRHEADGVIQRIPGYGKKVPPTIRDNLVGDVWPKFASPYPLAEPGSNLGAGKYFLACVQQHEQSTWDLYLVDIFDNMTPILKGGYITPIPIVQRPIPPVIPSHLKPDETEGTIYMANIYQGNGLKGYPKGTIKALRVGTHHYRYFGNGDTRASSFEGGWDIKRILGTVPVNEDGSACFRVPANTPIFVQPIDAEGKAQQLMRSWYTAMPGEVGSCIGCHERQNVGPPAKYNVAGQGDPVAITPWNGPVRGFSFDREVQPVLDRLCVGCHNDQPLKTGEKTLAAIDLRAKSLHPDFKGEYSPAYMNLQRYVRRVGYETDWHTLSPAEFEADTSSLVQLLKKGHYNVELNRDDWERLYTWIDYNIPYPATWRESHRPPKDELVDMRKQYKKMFANIDDHDEDPLPLPPIAAYQAPKPEPARPAPIQVEGWPFNAEQAKKMQENAGLPAELALDLGDSIPMKCRLIPAGRFAMGDPNGFADERAQAAVAIERPFYLGQIEVTYQQYLQFDPEHENGYVESRGKDRIDRGFSINAPDQPVVHVSWNRAMEFCRWLSQKTGRRCSLPSEAQWEWACRAGSAAPFCFGEFKSGMNNVANVADASAVAWNYGREEPGYNDGSRFSSPGGKYPANAWGLFDMHGNVAEWCASSYRAYPYQAGDGRESGLPDALKVVRGGSWNDTLRFATSASRWRYQPHQPIYNVGFRVLVEVPTSSPVAVK